MNDSLMISKKDLTTSHEVKVSVIVPFYNVEKYLDRCLSSILEQEIKEIEVILVNDCSPDSSIAIAEKYSKIDKRVKIIENEVNIGLGLSRQKGLDKAVGKYVSFIDSDDYISRNMFKEMVECAETGQFDMVGSNLTYFFSNGTSRENKIDYEEFCTHRRNYLLKKAFFINDNDFSPNSMCDKLYRREFIVSKGLTVKSERIYFLEDFVFNFDFWRENPNVAWLNKSYYFYMIRSGSTMYSYRANFLKRYLLMYDYISEKISAFPEKQGILNLIDKSLFQYTFILVFNGLKAPSFKSKVQEIISVIMNPQLRKNAEKFTFNDIPVTNSSLKSILNRVIFSLI